MTFPAARNSARFRRSVAASLVFLALMFATRPGRIEAFQSVEFPVLTKGLFRPHYVTWSEQAKSEEHAPRRLRNAIRIITETGLRAYKELSCMKKEQVHTANKLVFIADSKTPT